MLHETDSLLILNRMEVKYANKLAAAFHRLTGQKVEDVTKDHFVQWVKNNWFRLAIKK